MKILKKDNKEIHVCSLNEVTQARYVDKDIQTEVIIIGKNMTPYIVPAEINLVCNSKDRSKITCGLCRMCQEAHQKISLKNESAFLLELFDCTNAQQYGAIHRRYTLDKCQHLKITTSGQQNIEFLIVIPQIREESKYTTLGIYYQGHGLETNKSYLLNGIVVAHPTTQEATIIGKKVEELQGSIDKFKIDSIIFESLKIFQVEG
ncbi:MAG: hypothetical protein PHY56_00170 [Candidatus Omnitrophica bacterium]|nr:hypothetical protein [Candidatus Omnitrophota bacterium]